MTRSRAALVLVAILACAFAGRSTASPEIPGGPQRQPIALVGATVHPVSGPEIPEATLLFSDGRIVAVGRDVAVPAEARRIELRGKHVYPGLIDANSQLGLVEVPSIRGSRDQAETGDINPSVKAQVAFNPDSELIPVGRSGGVLSALVVPSGGLISGTSACMLLDGWTWEEMCLKPGVGLHVNWPQMAPIEAWWMEQTGAAQIETRDKSLATIRRAFADARSYQRAKQAHAAGTGPAPAFDARWEAMLPALAGAMPVYVAADELSQIQSALAFADEQRLRVVLVGGYDAADCAALLKKRDVPVIVAGVHRLPRRRNDPYDAPFTVPARLHAAGIKFCIAGMVGGPSGSLPANLRNLPYHAGAAAAAGLPPAEALRAITLSPAEILGVAERTGSLDLGKDATLIVADGDPLEIPTHVEMAFIGGREVQLNDRHKRLWEKYKEKYRRLGIQN